MKKVLLSLAAFTLSLGINAQNIASGKLESGLLEKAPVVSQFVDNSPAKAAKTPLAANQRYAGFYITDDLAASGIGFTALAGSNKMATFMGDSILAPWVGSKIVGIRFGLCYSVGASRVFLASLTQTGDIGADVVSKAVSSTQKGWNTVMFDTPHVIQATDAFMVGYDYKQLTSTQSESSFPISIAKKGHIYGTSYIYGNYPASAGGQGLAWYNIGDAGGNLSIQLIIESDNLPEKQVVFHGIGTDAAAYMPGQTGNANLTVFNNGTKDINAYAIDLMLNDTKVATYNSTAALASSGIADITVPFTVPQDFAIGNATLKATVATIDGAAPATATTALETKVDIRKLVFQQNVVVEEFTGTGCGYCPRGMAGMEKLSHQFGNRFIGIAIHQFNSTDPMYVGNYANMNWKGAPNCTLNRNGKQIDPYFGSGGDIVSDFEAALKTTPSVSVNVKGTWSADTTMVNATAEVTSTVTASNYTIAFVLVADSLTGTANAWRQSNYLAGDTPSSYGNDPFITPYVSGGVYGKSSFFGKFNDVLIGSSYSASGISQATLGALTADNTTTVSYTVPVNAKDIAKKALKPEYVYVVAIVIDNKGKIVNAGKTRVESNTTGIFDTTTTGKELKEVARYTIDGRQITEPQKGVNIVKMSDGTTLKVLVK